MEQLVLAIHILTAVSLIGFILLQQGKGAEVGASFGAGASQTIFGSQGSGNLMTRITACLATLFFITSLGLGYLKATRIHPRNLDELLKKVETQEPHKGHLEKKGSEKGSDIPKLPE